MDPLSLIGTVVGAGATIFGSAMNNKATANLNRTNRRWSAKEQREAEKRAHRRQKAGEKRAEKTLIRAERRAGKSQKRAEKRAEKLDIRSDLRDEQALIRSENREVERFEKYSDPQWIRDRAEAAGFNPLLFTGQASAYGGIGGAGPSGGIALPSGGGGGSAGYGGFTGTGAASNPAFSPMGDNGFGAAGELIANGFASYDEANLRAEELALRQTALEMENSRLNEVAYNARFGPSGRAVLEESPIAQRLGETIDERQGIVGATAEGGAPGRPGPYANMIPITTPDGQQIMIPAGSARRLDVKPFETVEAGVMTELMGEVVGEGSTLWNSDVIAANMGFNPVGRGEGQEGWGTVGGALRKFGEWTGVWKPEPEPGAKAPQWDGRNEWWSTYQRHIGAQ